MVGLGEEVWLLEATWVIFLVMWKLICTVTVVVAAQTFTWCRHLTLWATTTETECWNYWRPHARACAPQQENLPQWEAWAVQQRVAPGSPQLSKAHEQQRRFSITKNKYLKNNYYYWGFPFSMVLSHSVTNFFKLINLANRLSTHQPSNEHVNQHHATCQYI